jgi:hypothetical protein
MLVIVSGPEEPARSDDDAGVSSSLVPPVCADRRENRLPAPGDCFPGTLTPRAYALSAATQDQAKRPPSDARRGMHADVLRMTTAGVS